MAVHRLQLLLALVFFAGVAASQTSIDFLKDVQPVLEQKCVVCHSGASAQAGLKMHTRADLLQGGVSGPAIVPGNSEQSLMVAKIRGKQGMRMPPAGKPLSDETIEVIRAWIDGGAQFEGALGTADRAAAVAPRLPAVPDGPDAHPLDRLLRAYFEREGIAAPAPVSDAVFARRVWFDVTGLPPSPDDLGAFLSDDSENKRVALVDRLLSQNDAYAEHWITFWNDLLRNDEGVVYHGERKSITEWLYASLKNNKPYHQMVRELLNPARDSGAEGYLTGVTWRGVVSASQTPAMQASQNSAQVFLGMNLKCAACHDSFVNRWKLADTYGLAAMFTEEPLEMARCDVKLGKVAEPKFPYGESREMGAGLEGRREAAASWFTNRENGRFARTIVNRYWRALLGRGLVEPIDDMDAEPWDQDILDWLAWDFAEREYDLRALLRTILTSRAYQLPSVAAEAKDGYAFQGPAPRRLSAEQFLDTISVVSGAWRVNNPRSQTFAAYVREWRVKSDPLSRALGRPIRDQVYTERNQEASTLQALELTNGPQLAARIRAAAASLLGEAEAAPANLFDSKMVRRGAAEVDVDIEGARELWLVVTDVDSYDPAKVRVGWASAHLIGGGGEKPLAEHNGVLQGEKGEVAVIPAELPSMVRFPLEAGQFRRFRALAMVDEQSRRSDINPSVRFFVFTEKPDPERLVRVAGDPPVRPPARNWSSGELTDRLFQHLYGRRPAAEERTIALSMLGGETPTAAGTEDLLWAMLMSPEFQYIQ